VAAGAGRRLYVEPDGNARRQAELWRASRPLDAAAMDRLAAQPQAVWFAEWSGDITAAVDRLVDAATAAAAVPVLVAYNIPGRDCGSHSAGGSASAEAYRTWIRGFAEGIGDRDAVVVLEPDALALSGCLTEGDRQSRLDLLRDAVGVLAARSAATVYLDAGHSRWHQAADMAALLTRAGVARARGFALNVANFGATADELAYGRAIAAALDKHFVVDTSRNGLGPGSTWCNPPGRAVGDAPTSATGDPAADAFLWIKRPGESDGSCNGGPPAGQWWAEEALGLVQRSVLAP
jgi:endoglucanase